MAISTCDDICTTLNDDCNMTSRLSAAEKRGGGGHDFANFRPSPPATGVLHFK